MLLCICMHRSIHICINKYTNLYCSGGGGCPAATRVPAATIAGPCMLPALICPTMCICKHTHYALTSRKRGKQTCIKCVNRRKCVHLAITLPLATVILMGLEETAGGIKFLLSLSKSRFLQKRNYSKRVPEGVQSEPSSSSTVKSYEEK